MTYKHSIIIDYTNWRGERRKRRIQPLQLIWDANQWHPQQQWLLRAIDLEEGIDLGSIKTFAMAGIHKWENIHE